MKEDFEDKEIMFSQLSSQPAGMFYFIVLWIYNLFIEYTAAYVLKVDTLKSTPKKSLNKTIKKEPPQTEDNYKRKATVR